jgi:uncharacterized protein
MLSPRRSSHAKTHPGALSPVAPKRKGWRRSLRYIYLRFIRLRSSPAAIARGLAAGVFAGCFPLFGLQTIIGVSIAAIIRGNKLMAAAGTWVSNPLTYVPIYAFNLALGQQILGQEPGLTDRLNLDSWQGFMDAGQALMIRLLMGSVVVGAIAAVISYGLGLWLARSLHRSSR